MKISYLSEDKPRFRTDPQPWTIYTITDRLIFGSGGLHAYEDNELVVWHRSDLYAIASEWVIKCLAQAANRPLLDAIVKASDQALQEIQIAKAEKKRRKR